MSLLTAIFIYFTTWLLSNLIVEPHMNEYTYVLQW